MNIIMNNMIHRFNSKRRALAFVSRIILKLYRQAIHTLRSIGVRTMLVSLWNTMMGYAENGILRSIIKLIVVSGNLFFIFWIFFNGYNERFADTFGQIVRYMILMGLLGTNTLLLLRKPGRMT